MWAVWLQQESTVPLHVGRVDFRPTLGLSQRESPLEAMPPAQVKSSAEEGLEEQVKPTGDAYQEQYLIREETGRDQAGALRLQCAIPPTRGAG